MYETFSPTKLDLDDPEPGYWIVYNHPRGEEMLKWLEDNLGTKNNPLKEFTSLKYPESKFYGTSEDNLLLRWFDYQKQDQKNDEMWVHYNKIWSVFSKFGLKNNEVQKIIEWWVIETLQIRYSNTKSSVHTNFNML